MYDKMHKSCRFFAGSFCFMFGAVPDNRVKFPLAHYFKIEILYFISLLLKRCSHFFIGFIIHHLIYGFWRQGLTAFAAVIDFWDRGNAFKESKAIRPDADGGVIIHLLEFVAIGADSCDDYVE
ncbi:hypothetical protein F8125_001360 [Neisseria gonorrhoeae]